MRSFSLRPSAIMKDHQRQMPNEICSCRSVSFPTVPRQSAAIGEFVESKPVNTPTFPPKMHGVISMDRTFRSRPGFTLGLPAMNFHGTATGMAHHGRTLSRCAEQHIWPSPSDLPRLKPADISRSSMYLMGFRAPATRRGRCQRKARRRMPSGVGTSGSSKDPGEDAVRPLTPFPWASAPARTRLSPLDLS